MQQNNQLLALVGFILMQAMPVTAQLHISPQGDVFTPNKITIGALKPNPVAALQVAVPDMDGGIGIDIVGSNTSAVPLRIVGNKDNDSGILLLNKAISPGGEFRGGIEFKVDADNSTRISSISSRSSTNPTSASLELGHGFSITESGDNRGIVQMGGGGNAGLLSVTSMRQSSDSYNVRYFNLKEPLSTEVLQEHGVFDLSISIYAKGNILADEFDAYSDARIKKDYRRSDRQTDLAVLKQIKVTDYRYKDAVQHGTAFKKGVLAQELEQVFPQAVSKHTDYITDIFSMPQQVSLTGTTLTVHMDKPHGLATGDMLRLITPEALVDTLVEVLDAQTFMVKNWTRGTTDVFVYGKKTDDFRAVDFDRLTVLSIGAIQQLCQKAETLKQSVRLLEARAAQLEKTIQTAAPTSAQK